MARTLPDWPALMRRDYAAAYLDMPITKFERGVMAGKLPQPVEVLGEERWSRVKLDECLLRIAGGRQDNRAKSRLYAA